MMATLLCELTRAVSVSIARQMRERAGDRPLDRSEMRAVAMVLDISTQLHSMTPPDDVGTPDWESFEKLAEFDVQCIESRL